MTDSPSTTFSLGSPVGSSVKTCRFEPARRFRALCGTAPCSPSLLPAEELARRTTWAAHALAMDATKPEARSPRSLAGSGPQSWIRALWSVLSSPSWEQVLCCSFLRAARSRSTSAVWKLSTKNAPSTRAARSSSWWCCFKMGPQNSCLGQNGAMALTCVYDSQTPFMKTWTTKCTKPGLAVFKWT